MRAISPVALMLLVVITLAAPAAAIGPSATFGSAALTSAEQLLLSAVPRSIRPTCTARRSDLPTGTVAALQCKPAAAVVRDMAYYLMDSGPAGRVFEERRAEASVVRDARCVRGRPATTTWVGGMPTAELCYRNDDQRANLRFLEPATECRQLTVGDRTLRAPTIYIAVLGQGRDIAGLARWATDDGKAQASALTRFIEQPGNAWSNACPR